MSLNSYRLMLAHVQFVFVVSDTLPYSAGKGVGVLTLYVPFES